METLNYVIKANKPVFIKVKAVNQSDIGKTNKEDNAEWHEVNEYW